jgi:DNA-binding transcriptional LysR family regulator
MDHIDRLRIFCAVVDARSFTRAAEMLGISGSVVSRAIAGLEERLGVRLFHRTTRQISLTEAAEHFYAGCVRVLADLDALEDNTSNQAREATGVLRLIAHTTAATNRLPALIASFKRKHPKVGVDVTLSERPVDLVAEGYDVGLLLPYMFNTDSIITRLLERIPFLVVASPAYLQAHSEPAHPSDLAQHVFVAMTPSIRKPELTFRIGREDLTVPIRYEVASNNASFNLDMVLQGFGIGVLPIPLARAALAAGQLVSVLDRFKLVDFVAELRLVYSSRTLLPAKMRAFIDHTAEHFNALSDASQAG